MDLKCMTCFMQQAVKAAALSTADPGLQLKAVKKAARSLSDLDPEDTPPEIATDLFKIIIDVTGNPDAYKELKKKSNETVAGLLDTVRGIISSSADPFAEAVKISLCGNIIDYGILDDFDIEKLIREESATDIDREKTEKFRRMAASSMKTVFIADNAGEIGLDALLLARIKQLNPACRISVLVKSTPLINDALLEDALYFGMDAEFEIIEYPDTVGFKLKGMPGDISRLIGQADLIISKGQANYEILNDAGMKNTVFLLRAKCDVVARSIGVEEGSPVLIV
ncbi:MAG: ARMT1-like domain-containing protein [Elusimicrobiota bacterium]